VVNSSKLIGHQAAIFFRVGVLALRKDFLTRNTFLFFKYSLNAFSSSFVRGLTPPMKSTSSSINLRFIVVNFKNICR
jgi:hypothetical protein